MDLFQILKTLPKMRQAQLRQAVFVNLISDIEELTTFSKLEREQLCRDFELIPYKIIAESVSKDGSIKWLLEFPDGARIETVLLSFRDGRNTVCVSSQAGCPAGCAFCATGKGGFRRNLSGWEIVSQVLLAGRKLKAESKKLSNVVFMGMGEPLFNMDNLLTAIDTLNDHSGLNIGARHMTISTCGPIRELRKFIANKTRTTLAISLHAPDQKLREKLMPIAKVNPLSELMEVVDDYLADGGRRVSFEYIMLENINDGQAEALALVKLLKGRLAHINLIRFNEVDGIPFRASSTNQVNFFKSVLETEGLSVTVRVSLGDEIAAACGQLAGKN